MAGVSRWTSNTCGRNDLSNWKEVKLGLDAVEYVREYLLKGHTLSECLLQRHDLFQGAVFACVPSSVSDRTAENFRDGPLLPEPKPQTHIRQRNKDGSTVTLIPVPNTDNILAEIIKTFLERTKVGACVFEEAAARPSDPCMSSSTTAWIEYNDEVYYFLLHSDATLGKIQQAIRQAASVYPGLIGVMTRMPDPEFSSRRKRITASGLRELARNTEKIIIGAYDGEGYLIWERS
jgi:hypothetical protein